MKDKYCFPAIFDYAPDGISISFPDLPGCLSCADNYSEALYMAQDALEGRLYIDEQHRDFIPEPSNPLEIKISLAPNQIVVPIEANLKKVREQVMNKAVNKMVTLPRWLIEEGKKADINFSHLLQDALMDKLGISPEVNRKAASR